MLTEKKWYAVYTKPRWEKKVAALLDKKSIEVYCPLNRILRQWSDRKKTVYEPLFKSYVFVRVSKDEMIAVKETEGIIKFVHWLNKPAEIRNEEIEIIREFLNEYMNVWVEEMGVGLNDEVRIVNGPFMEYKGNILDINKDRVKVFLHSLRYSLVVEVAKSNLEVLKRKRTPVAMYQQNSQSYSSKGI